MYYHSARQDEREEAASVLFIVYPVIAREAKEVLYLVAHGMQFETFKKQKPWTYFPPERRGEFVIL